jgi:hypothetical protein
MTEFNLNFAVENLAFIRSQIADEEACVKRMRREYEEKPEFVNAVLRLETARKEAAELETTIREHALHVYQTTGAKKPHDAVAVKVMTRLQYDPERAAGFCLEHLPSAIKVDYKTFEKHAKNVADTAPLDFVEFVEEPQAQIATDLSKFVK